MATIQFELYFLSICKARRQRDVSGGQRSRGVRMAATPKADPSRAVERRRTPGAAEAQSTKPRRRVAESRRGFTRTAVDGPRGAEGGRAEGRTRPADPSPSAARRQWTVAHPPPPSAQPSAPPPSPPPPPSLRGSRGTSGEAARTKAPKAQAQAATQASVEGARRAPHAANPAATACDGLRGWPVRDGRRLLTSPGEHRLPGCGAILLYPTHVML